VRIGAGCYIGAGATIIDRVTIGEWSTVGAGAVVVGDLPPFVTAVGVPAKVIKRHQ
jgi:acetyltransferase-like isoleucine patch superfamily enzyme